MAFLAIWPTLDAQSLRQMNMIKRSSQYIYSEATMATAEEAHQVAYERLLAEIKTYAQGKKQLTDENNIAIRNISSKCESIEMPRGEMFKVFLYVKKSDINEAANLTVLVKDGENASEVVSIGNEWTLKPDTVQDLPSENKETGKKKTGDPVKVATNVNHSGAADPSLKLNEAWKQKAIDELLNAPSFAEARSLMSVMKREFKIKKYGRPAECADWNGAFWLIGDAEGRVVTVLGPEDDGRTDFRKLSKTDLNEFSGYDAVWFTLSK